MENKIDKRRTYYLVLDVETTMDKMVYDIGYAVADKHGNIYHEGSFIVPEVFFNKEKMQSAFYWDKYNDYLAGAGFKWAVFPMFRIRGAIHRIMKMYNIDKIAAYNCNFDRTATEKTWEALYPNAGRFFPENCKYYCIQHMATQVLFTQPTYLKHAALNGWESEKGNVRTKAEHAYRYISNNDTFDEEHTGLKDVEIEVQIMAKCFAQHKHMEKGVYSACWKIPQKKYQEVKKKVLTK